jgi:hypothetical protein
VRERLQHNAEATQPALSLFAVGEQSRRIRLTDKTPVPPDIRRVALQARIPPGSFAYVVTFGATGGAKVLAASDLERAGWILPLSGPPPAETVLLLTVPRPLRDDEARELQASIAEVPGPRSISGGGQVVWTDEAEPAIVPNFSSRSLFTGTGTQWVNAIRSRLLRIAGAHFRGRTFEIPRPVE